MKNRYLYLLLIFFALMSCQRTAENDHKFVSHEPEPSKSTKIDSVALIFAEEEVVPVTIPSSDTKSISEDLREDAPLPATNSPKENDDQTNFPKPVNKTLYRDTSGSSLTPIKQFSEGNALTQWPEDNKQPATFGFGKEVTQPEMAAWDVEVKPDVRDLPAGSGTVGLGKEIYADRCAICHGFGGKGIPSDTLAGEEALQTIKDLKTIGTYWPYATTLFKFIETRMPHDQPGSLQPDEVYSLVAFILHENDILPPDVILNAQILSEIKMPAKSGND